MRERERKKEKEREMMILYYTRTKIEAHVGFFFSSHESSPDNHTSEREREI